MPTNPMHAMIAAMIDARLMIFPRLVC